MINWKLRLQNIQKLLMKIMGQIADNRQEQLREEASVLFKTDYKYISKISNISENS